VTRNDPSLTSPTDTNPGRHHVRRFRTERDVLDFAIAREMQSYAFYHALAERTPTPSLRPIFERFARQELAHKMKLLDVIASGRPLLPRSTAVESLGISDYLPDDPPPQHMDFGDALKMAMKAEKSSFALYVRLSEEIEEPNLRLLFVALAEEEAAHKLSFESAYEDYVFERQRRLSAERTERS